jgi:hypothetical protein
MNRLLVLVAFASLGTGCIVGDTCDVRTVSIGWPSFHRADGNPAGCSTAGVGGVPVTSVDVWMDGMFVTNQPCNGGGVNVDLVPAGTHTWTVEGRSDADAIVNRDSFSTSGDGCDTIIQDTQPAQGYVDLQYLFYDGATELPPLEQVCATNSLLWLSIYDQTAVDLAVLVDATHTPQVYTCGGPFILPLPIGPFTLDWMEERGPQSGGFTLESADCTDRPFTVFAGDGSNGTPVPVNLDIAAPAACTRR